MIYLLAAKKNISLPWQPYKVGISTLQVFPRFLCQISHFIFPLYMLIRIWLHFFINLTDATHNTALYKQSQNTDSFILKFH